MYNALNSLGAGGLATPWYANATAAAGYVFMAFMCICGGILVSKIGLRKSLIVRISLCFARDPPCGVEQEIVR